MRISDWSSDVCSSDLQPDGAVGGGGDGQLIDNEALPLERREPVDQHRRLGGGNGDRRLPRAPRLVAVERQPDLARRLRKIFVDRDRLARRRNRFLGGPAEQLHIGLEIGRPSSRERVCSYVYVSVLPVSLKKS